MAALGRFIKALEELLAQIQQWGLEADVAVGSSLVDMYAKCGSKIGLPQTGHQAQQLKLHNACLSKSLLLPL